MPEIELDCFEIDKTHIPDAPKRGLGRALTSFLMLIKGPASTPKILGLLLFCLLPFMVGSHTPDVNDVSLDQITEIGCPYDEAGFFMAAGKRYQIGDSLRLEGVPGKITKISREGIWVNGHEYSAPPLILFERDMCVDGNFVVYPGSPRHIAGNFWLGHSQDLDQVPPGYVSWLGGYWSVFYARIRAGLVMGCWSKITGENIICHGDNLLVVQPKYQLKEYLERLGREGAQVNFEEDQIEVILP